MAAFLILVLSALSLAIPAAGATTRSLSFCFDERGAALWYGSDGRGEAISRLDAIAAAKGLDFDYRPMAGEGCQLAAANGRVDGILGLAYRDDLQWAGAFPPEAPGDNRRALFIEGIVLVRHVDTSVDIVDGNLVGLRAPLTVVAGSEAAREFRALGLRVDDRNRNPRSLLERTARSPVGAAALGWARPGPYWPRMPTSPPASRSYRSRFVPVPTT